ncbi:DNA-directed RNA polymerase subunit beta [Candidatus Parcubacteria bacterium]|nr:MAG: DNA-directed RNA polymerase subunit beta [Candidatus Parcubacteria bacterium]
MLKQKHFNLTHRKSFTPPPHLIEAQLDSFGWFFKIGLRELFDEISPILDYTGKELALWFDDYYFDEAKYDERTTKIKGLTYEAPLRVRLRLENKRTGEIKEQEVFFGDFPIMTKRGTFIVNGVERVVVSQIMRSAGVLFTENVVRGKKLFGAKVIPNRGAWLEFESDADGAIYVRIDRKRRIAATSLLRIFGLTDDEKIKKEFAKIDTNEDIKHIEATLKKDAAHDQAGSYIEIYKRLRPGDLATTDNAKQLINNMFFSFARYDLSRVGRYKFDLRLGGLTSEQARSRKVTNKDRLLSLADIINVLKEIIRLNNAGDSHGDDVDHLGNRRVRAVGESLQNRFRIGLVRMDRIIRDRMSTLEVKTLAPAQLINPRPLVATVREFFTSSQLSQFMDQVNPLAELEHKRRLSAMGPGGLTRERASFEVRDVHPSHYGRICPIQTPEGPNIGLVNHLALFARINEFGFIETPYRKVKHGKVTEELIYLTATEEERFNIAHAGVIAEQGHLPDRVEARIKGQPGVIEKDKVDFIDVSPQQFLSVATSLIPFLEHDDANRALMGSNMQRQAVASVRPQVPLVSTGMEAKAAVDSGQVVLAEEDGIITEVDANHITVKPLNVRLTKTGTEKTYQLHNFIRSNQFTSVSQRPLVKRGQHVKAGDVIADGACVSHGQLALGQNLLVAFLSFRGNTFEDAIVISEKLLKEDRFTSVHIESFTCDVRDTKLGPEVTTPDIPGVGEDKLKDLDEEGIVRVGAEVRANDILVGKISPKGEADLTPEERLLRAIFGEKAKDVKDTSKLLEHGKRGRVIGIQVFDRDKGDHLSSGVIKSIQVDIAQLRKVAVGDKLAGRHGNKGVIAKVLPEEDMPYLEDGTPVDIVLNPLGVASRMNIGQILETHLGWAAHKLGYQAICPSLDGAIEEQIKADLKEAGLPQDGKVVLYDGRTGERFEQKVTVGQIYMMKLNHLVEDKIHMRSIGPYSLITQQPLGGKAQFGGQRFGEMEVWALEGYGASHILQEMLTIKSDDVIGRTAAYDAIIRGEKIKKPNIPASFHVLANELRGLGLAVDLIGAVESSDDGKTKGVEGESLEESARAVAPKTKL